MNDHQAAVVAGLALCIAASVLFGGIAIVVWHYTSPVWEVLPTLAWGFCVWQVFRRVWEDLKT
jgi:hypothetical protein